MTCHRQIFRLAACLGSGFLFWFPALAATNGLLRPEPPPVPKLRSPVETFRQLLTMNSAERRQFLTNRPPEIQRRVLAKVREYESLKEGEREVRLRATELQWYLLPLMTLPSTNRAARLALVPDEQRTLVEVRLKRWDELPPVLQQDMLDNELTARYFAQLRTETNREAVLGKMSPERRAKLERGLDLWRGLSEEQRQKTLASFNAFFELTPREKERALNTLSEAEQRQMEKTLQAYAKLSFEQRQRCISSFEKFTGMTLEERQLFLKNAERWKLMSPAERAAWSHLVDLAPVWPPLPSGRRLSPPKPPGLPPRQPIAAVATN